MLERGSTLSTFSVQFINKTLTVNDILRYSTEQIRILREYSANKKIEDVIKLASGKKVPLRKPLQINQILSHKATIFVSNDYDLLKNNIILFEGHVIDRILLRVENSGLIIPREDVVISLVGKLRDTDDVDENAEFKGYPTLAFTLFKKADKEKFRISISFKSSGKKIKAVTLTNINIDKLVAKVKDSLPNKKVAELEDFKAKLIKAASEGKLID
jgi:hypothetical protein